MAGINQIRRVNVLNILKILKDDYGIDRNKFAEITGINYNLLNQYLSENAKKNIGNKTATAITKPLDINPEWLDQIRNELEIKLILNNSFGATRNVVDNTNPSTNVEVKTYNLNNTPFTIIPILKTIYIYRGKELKIIDNETIKHAVEAPSGLIDPVAYEITGSGYNRPFKKGFVLICDSGIYPNGGDDTIVKTVDDKIFIGEFVYDRESEIEVETIEGTREIIEKSTIDKISTIVAFLNPRQKRSIDN